MNLVKFILTEKSLSGNCKLTHPMLSFYTWSILDFIANIIWLIFAVEASDNVMPMVVYLPAAFKVLIGIEQIWLMIELVVQINRARRIMEAEGDDDTLTNDSTLEMNIQTDIARENKLLNRGRIVVTVLEGIYLATILVLC